MHRTMQRTVNSDTSRVTRAVSTVEIKPWSKSIDCITRESDTCECRRAILRRVTKIALFSTRHGPHKSRNARRYARIAERDRRRAGGEKKSYVSSRIASPFSPFFFLSHPRNQAAPVSTTELCLSSADSRPRICIAKSPVAVFLAETRTSLIGRALQHRDCAFWFFGNFLEMRISGIFNGEDGEVRDRGC